MLESLDEVSRHQSNAEIDLTLHVVALPGEREISKQEIRQAGAEAIVIEEYSDDKYSPSCLMLGFSDTGRPLHIQVSLADMTLVRVITVYEPDSSYWTNYTTRG